MIEIKISDLIYAACPHFAAGVIVCDVKNTTNNVQLWEEIDLFSEAFKQSTPLSAVNKLPNILETRQVYKKLGKDPNRYRPSGEALCRRIVRGLPLYQIDTLVDLVNLLSIKSGYSIGAFDANTISGSLELGVGKANEAFDAIGRGQLNIEGLPVYRDSIGGIGTPTSDEERTKIRAETTKLLLLINGYSGEDGLPDAIEYATYLLKKYASADNIQKKIIGPPGK